MRLAGGVAYEKNAVRITRPDAGPDRARGEPSAVKLGVAQRMAHTIAMSKNVLQHRIARGEPQMLLSACLQHVAPNTTGQAHAAVIAVYQAAISAWKDK